MYGENKEIQGIKEHIDDLLEKKRFFTEQYTLATDVETQFALPKKIEKIDKEIEEYRQKLVGYTPSVLRIDSFFIDKLKGELTEEQIKGFYLAHHHDYLQFCGLVNGLGAKQVGEDDFFEQLNHSFHNSKKRLIGQVIGSGGTGKTTFLRQIALRWTTQTGNPVFWIEESDYDEIDPTILKEQIPEDALLIADEAEQNASILKKIIKKMPNHRFVVASRKFPEELRYFANANEYSMDKIDLALLNKNILEKLATHLPINEALQENQLSNIKPFPLLFVILRSLETDKDLSLINDVERTFSEIIQNDLKRLKETGEEMEWNKPKQLAQALQIFAYIFVEYKRNITNIAFQDLATEAIIGTTPKETNQILSYYLDVFVNEKDKKGKIKETPWIFHKDDLAEEIYKNLQNQEKLFCEKQAEKLLDSQSQWTASNMLWSLVKDKKNNIPFLKAKVEELLEKQNTHHAYMSAVTKKNNYLALNDIEIWNYIERFLSFNPNNMWFTAHITKYINKERAIHLLKMTNITNSNIVCTCLNLLENEAKKDARRLLNIDNQKQAIICACLKLLGNEAKEDARRLLNIDSQDPAVLCSCLNLLGNEAKEKARELLKDKDQNKEVLCTCLNLLGNEAKEKARELLKDKDQNKKVLCACLNLLGNEAREKARELLKDRSQNYMVLCACLRLLGNEAKEEARELLNIENQHYSVLNACLNLLGNEAREKARELLKDRSQNYMVLCACLRLLGNEAKEEARELLKVKNQNYSVLTACLRLLGDEAKEEAKKLLKDRNQNHSVLNACLNLLGNEAKEKARELLKDKNQHYSVLCVCLNLLGNEAKEKARELLKDKNQHYSVLCVCLNLLGNEAKEDARELLESKNQHNDVVCVCLSLLGRTNK